MLAKLKPVVMVASLGLVLGACDGGAVKQSLGIKRNNPDAFRVVARPPLSVPPVYHLNPPSDQPLESTSTEDQAKSLLIDGKELPRTRKTRQDFGAKTAVTGVGSSSLGTAAESTLLGKAGANTAQPDIRSVLNEEEKLYYQEKADEGVLDKLKVFDPDEHEPVVDAKAEAERIKAAKEEGKPINEGEVEEIDPNDGGMFNKIFD